MPRARCLRLLAKGKNDRLRIPQHNHRGTAIRAAAQSDWRKVRRTSRTALNLLQSDAIIGDDAVNTPSEQDHAECQA
jgi:hypothetical protein